MGVVIRDFDEVGTDQLRGKMGFLKESLENDNGRKGGRKS